jgi:hypothetical protein
MKPLSSSQFLLNLVDQELNFFTMRPWPSRLDAGSFNFSDITKRNNMSYFGKNAPVETVKEEGTSHEYISLDHDAFGQLTVQRVQTTGPEETLFQSDLMHREVIQLTLRRAHVDRRNYKSDVMEDEVIARFNMSAAQWSELISSPTMGGSIPVTLRHAPARGTEADGMPMINAMSIQERQSKDIQAKFAAYMETGKELLTEIERISGSQGAISKPQLRELARSMQGFVNGLPNTFAFMHQIMQSESSEIIAHAKSEIAAHVDAVAHRVGLEHLRNQSPAGLPAPEGEEGSR